jgi:hypothetical protein
MLGKTKQIADALKADLIASRRTSVGGNNTFDWLRFASFPGETNLQDWYGLTPMVLVHHVNQNIIANCQEGPFRVDEVYDIFRLTCIIQMYDMSYGTNSPNVPDNIKAIEYATELDTRYGRARFSIHQGSATTVAVRTGVPTIPGLQVEGNNWAHAVEIDIEHIYIEQTTPVLT